MQSKHKDAEGAPPPSRNFKPPPEERRGCLMCERGFPTAQALTRHRNSPACGPPIDLEAEQLMLTSKLPKVRLKLKAPEEGRYTPNGVVAEDDVYLHSSKEFEFLCDASGILELPPTPEHAHDPMVACSSLYFCEREGQFDILE